jgi:hypothetical protein
MKHAINGHIEKKTIAENETCFVAQESKSKSEFKLYGSLKDPKFILEDNFGEKVDIISIQVAENKYSFKIMDAKTGNYFLKITIGKNIVTRLLEIK